MKLYTGSALPPIKKCVITLGMFDGCHNGHRQVLRRAARVAREMNCPLLVWTYAQHPLRVVAPHLAPQPLQSVSQRVRSFAQLGVDILCLRPFTRQEADTPPEVLVRRFTERMGMRAIVLGRSNTFGKDAKGTPAYLEKEGIECGFDVEIVDTVKLGSERINSSTIRQMLEAGEMRTAAAMLGHCYALDGEVVKGKKIGRSMGFPTINITLPKGRLMPHRGVYAGWADIGKKSYPCALNLGIKPTVGGEELSLEANLLDYSGNLYGKRVSVRFFQFLRPERKFNSVDHLSAAIAQDVRNVRRLLMD